jgi:molybdate transport system regulatory protein
LRLDFDGERSLGPGKVQLLELVEATGSISAAGRALKMSYGQAWMLIDELNAGRAMSDDMRTLTHLLS